jgi:hypothetical protein
MRCPKCRFISADKRDICPKCLLDLREEKKKLGLTITKPNASYEDLLRAAKGKKVGAKKKKVVAPEPVKVEAAPIQKEAGLWKKLTPKLGAFFSKKKGGVLLVERKETPKPIEQESVQQISASAALPIPQASNQLTAEPATTSSSKLKKVVLDEKEFDSLFEDIPEENPEEMIAKLTQDIKENVAQALSSTELLRELPTITYASQSSNVAPKVVEFNEDDDDALEEQLNKLLGDEILQVSAVKKPKKAPEAPIPNSIKVDDMEISFEFDMDEGTSEPVVVAPIAEAATASMESKSITELQAALSALDADIEDNAILSIGFVDSNASKESEINSQSKEEEEEEELEEILDELDVDEHLESLKNDLLGLDDDESQDSEERDYFDLSILKGSIPAALKDRPSELADYILQVLADAVGCEPEALFKENKDSIGALEQEIAQLDAVQELEDLGVLDSHEEGETSEEEVEEYEDFDDTDLDDDLEEDIENDEAEEFVATESSSTEFSLWDEIEQELETIGDEGEELDVVQLFSQKPREEILVLFDSALKAIEDKKVEEAYKTNVKLSVNRELEHDDLSLVFEKFGDAALDDYKNNKAWQKQPAASVAVTPAEAILFEVFEVPPPPASVILKLALKCLGLGMSGALAYLWFIELGEAARAAIWADHLLFWLALPYLAKNLGIGLILSLILFYLGKQTLENSLDETPLTL